MPGEIRKLKYIADEIREELVAKINTYGADVRLACLVAGEHAASESYINGIVRNSEKLGIKTELVRFSESVTENEFVKKMDEINRDDKYSGMILQLPLPRQISHSMVSRLVDYRKDVDGVSPFNQGLLFAGQPFMVPATAWAVDLTLAKITKERGMELAGKKIAIVGRSVTVGKPVFHLALKRNMVPVVLHTKAQYPEEIAADADIVVACCGVAELINENWVKDDAIVIDVGINTKNDETGKSVLCGDVNAAAVNEVASLVTAVPGGIGGVTSALLFANTLKGWYMVNKRKELKFDFEV